MNFHEDYSKEREHYSLLALSFLDSTIQTNTQQPQVILIYINNQLDESIAYGSTTTIFVHATDVLRLAVFSNSSSSQAIGSVDVSVSSLLHDPAKLSQKWLALQPDLPNKRNQILCQFEIQKITDLQSYQSTSKVYDNLSNNRGESPQKGAFSPSKTNRSSTLPSSNPPQYSLRIDDDVENDAVLKRRGLLGKYRQVNKSVSPMTPKKLEQSHSATKAPLVESQTFQRIQGKKSTDTQLYHELDAQLTKLKKMTQNSQFNNLVEMHRQNYLEMKNILREITEQFNALKRHPCNNCEKKYVPSIEKGMAECHAIIKFLLESAAMNNSTSKATGGLHHLSSVSSQDQSSQKAISSSSASTAKLRKMMKDVEEKEEQTKEENRVIKMMRDELDMQRKKTSELEAENRSIKMRMFMIEGDLKNMLKKLSTEKLTFSARATFKMQEFRSIFEFFHSLRLEREALLSQIAEAVQSTSAIIPEKHRNTKKEGKPSIPLKTIAQTMAEYEQMRDNTLASVRIEENRVQAYKDPMSMPYPYTDNYEYFDHNQEHRAYGNNHNDQIIRETAINEERLRSQYHERDHMSNQKRIRAGSASGFAQDHPKSVDSKNEIQELLSQRKNVIDELLVKLEGI